MLLIPLQKVSNPSPPLRQPSSCPRSKHHNSSKTCFLQRKVPKTKMEAKATLDQVNLPGNQMVKTL